LMERKTWHRRFGKGAIYGLGEIRRVRRLMVDGKRGRESGGRDAICRSCADQYVPNDVSL